MLIDDARTIEETYTSATTSSNLRCDTRENAPQGDADLLIAAGWSRSRMGAALLRLHTEFDRYERPNPPTRAAIDALALTMPKKVAGPGNGPMVENKANPKKWATAVAWGWHKAELQLLVGKLKTLPEVRTALTHTATVARIENPASTAAQVIAWWLHQTCRVCNGTKEQEVRGTGRLSGQVCRECHGSGKSPTPGGSDGRRLANIMDDSIEAARDSIHSRLRPRH